MSGYRAPDVTRARTAAPPRAIRAVIIDDSRTVCQGAAAVLRGAGCHAVTAADGFAALVEIVDCRPHIIFIDNCMPRLDGYQTCAVIRRNGEFRHIPVILLTNLDQAVDHARAAAAGINGYLTKPFTAGELLRSVRQHVRHGVGEDD